MPRLPQGGRSNGGSSMPEHMDAPIFDDSDQIPETIDPGQREYFRYPESASATPQRSISASTSILGNIVPENFGSNEVTGYIGAIDATTWSLDRIIFGIVFALGEQDSVASLEINGEDVSGLSWVHSYSTHVGDGSTALSSDLTAIPDWSSDDTTRWKGLAHAVITILKNEASVPGALNVTAFLGGRLFSDFRTSTTAAHTNQVDIAYHLRTHADWIENPTSRLDSDSWETVAGWCDDTMSDATARYTWVGRLERRDPDGALSDVLGSIMADEYVGPDGKVKLWCEMLPPLVPGTWSASASNVLTGDSQDSIIDEDFTSSADWSPEAPETSDDEWLDDSGRLLYRHKDTVATGNSHAVLSKDGVTDEPNFSANLECQFLVFYSGKSFDYWGHSCLFFRGRTVSSAWNGYAAGIKYEYDNSGGGGGTTGEYAIIKIFKLEGATPTRTEIGTFTTTFNTYTDDSTWAISEKLRLRLDVNGTLIKCRAWEDGDSEPSGWDLEVSDSTFTETGGDNYIGVYGYANAYNGDGWGWAAFRDLAVGESSETADASSVSVGDAILFEDNSAAEVTAVDDVSDPNTITVDETKTITSETLRLISGIHLQGDDWVSVPEAADIDLGTIPDVVQVRYHGTEIGDEHVYPEDLTPFSKRTEVTVEGCTVASQARRVSETRRDVRKLQRITWRGTSAAKAQGLEPGDIFRISDDVLDKQLVMALSPIKVRKSGYVDLIMRLFDQDAYSAGVYTRTVELPELPGGGWDGDSLKAAYTPSISSKTTTYTVTATPEVILCDASGGAFTVTLVTAVGIAGYTYAIKKTDSSSNAVTVDADGTETIDGDLTKTITNQWTTMTLVSDGANWVVT